MTLYDCVASLLSWFNSLSERKHKELTHMKSVKSFSESVEEADELHGEVRQALSPYGEANPMQAPAQTLLEVVSEACGKFATRRAIAYRPVLKETSKTIVDPNGKTKEWKYTHLAPTEYISYEEFWGKVERLGSALEGYGLSGQDCRIGLFADTRWEWITALYGLWTQSAVGVTVYSTLDKEALAHALQEADLSAIFVSGDKIKDVLSINLPTLRYIFSFDPIADDIVVPESLEIVTFHSLCECESVAPANQPSLEDLAVIMYTSGTTGLPKGVMMTHENLACAVHIMLNRIQVPFGVETEKNESYIAFLPIAHILELTAENVMFCRGAMVGYGNARTLTDLSTIPHGDLKEYKPSLFVGVPKIFDAIKKSIESKVAQQGGLQRAVFKRAYDDKKRAFGKGMDTPYWNRRVFDRFAAILGGNVGMIVCGGAPLNSETYEFLTVVFNVSVGQGYGLTETAAMSSLQHFWDIEKDTVGAIVNHIQVKLRNVDHWQSANNQGEILMRGPHIAKGYFKQPEKTEEVFLKDGWFATGDIGEWLPDGKLRIVGRIKALAKNSYGEYIALEALESVYTNNELVIPNGICILVHPLKPFIAALVLTDEDKVTAFLSKHGIKGSYPDVLFQPLFMAKALESLRNTARGLGRQSFELIQQIYISGHPKDEWTVENGILTAAMKIKRREIEKKYTLEIQQLFKM